MAASDIDNFTMFGFHGYVDAPVGAALPWCPSSGGRDREEVSATGLFLAEKYVPTDMGADLAAVVDHDRRAERMSSIRHVRTTYVPGDEMCFSLFEAPSLQLMEEANIRFQLGYRRMTEVFEVHSDAGGHHLTAR